MIDATGRLSSVAFDSLVGMGARAARVMMQALIPAISYGVTDCADAQPAVAMNRTAAVTARR